MIGLSFDALILKQITYQQHHQGHNSNYKSSLTLSGTTVIALYKFYLYH